jgi:HEAT repeat protein
MKKSTKGLLLAAGVIGAVFGIALVYLKFSPPLDPESVSDRRRAEMQRLKGIVLSWNALDASARRAALPDLPKAWQFADEDLRWHATLVLGHAGPEAVPILLAALNDSDDETRMRAVWALGILGPDAQPALEAVRGRLKDSNPAVRSTALFAVRRIATDPGPVVPELAALLADGDPEVRETASRTMAAIGKPAVAELRKMLKHEALDVRRLAVTTLGRIGPEAADAVPDFVAILRDTQSGLQDETTEALAGIGAPAVAALAAALKQQDDPALRKLAILALARVGKPAVPLLGGALADKDPSVRLQAVTALGRIGPDAVDTVVAAFRDEDVEVRQETARVLGTMDKNDKGVVPALVKALRDPAPAVRDQAGLSLQALRPDTEAVLNELTPLLDDKNLDARLAGIRLLAEFGPSAVPRLTALLKDPEVAVWREASSTLEKLPAPVKVLFPALVPLLTDENVTARQNAVNILWRCGPQAVPHLLKALQDKAPTVRLAAVRSLDKVTADTKEIFPALVQALEDEHPAVRGSAAATLGRFGTPALPHLRLALKDKDFAVRQYAVLALGQVQSAPKEVLPLLEQARKDENAKVRQSAAFALKGLGQPALPLLIDMLTDPDDEVWKQAVDSLKDLRAKTQGLVKLLGEAIKHENFSVRRGAAYVLSRCGDEGVPALVEGLKDKDWRIRWEAADSLRVVGPVGDKALPALASLAVNDNMEKVRQMALKAMLQMYGLDRFTDDPAKAVPSLVEAVQTKDAENRYYAVLILGAIGPAAKDAKDALSQATKDKDARVQQAATAALGRIGR